MASIRTYLNILLAIVVLGITAACSDHDNMLGGDDYANVRLTLQLGEQTIEGTRAIDEGENALNENQIDKVELFFYSTEGAKNGEQPIYTHTQTFDTKSSAEINISMPRDKFKGLFPYDADSCKVYAIVNRPATDALPVDKSLASLKGGTTLHAPDFKPADGSTTVPTQSNFVMDGEASLARNADNLIGIIPVERVAVKISLVIGDIKNVTDNGQTWEADVDSVKVSLYNASTRTYLGSTYIDDSNNDPAYIYSAQNSDIFNIENIKFANISGKLTINTPIYTYPTYWKENEKLRTYFVLAIKWNRKEDGVIKETKTTYYEINVNAGGSYTQRNRHYKIIQEVGVLGSETLSDATLLYPCTYLILDWGSTKDNTSINNNTHSDANLGSFKYLVVDEVVTEMKNVFSKQIYFFSSDPIDLNTAKIEWEYTGGTTSEALTFVDKEIQDSEATIDPITGDITYTIENTETIDGITNRIQGDYALKVIIHNSDPTDDKDRSYIFIEHYLDNNMTETSDYTEYTITLNVAHADNNKYNQTIKITQYPMISIVAEMNSYYKDDNNPDNDNDNRGGVYVNASEKTKGNYGGAHGLIGSNKNPNRYIISVTSLAKGSSYIIGDPRNNNVSNPPGISEFVTDETMKYTGDTNNRKLKYYHPTIETDVTKNMISPQFMIASSYGVTNPVNKDGARNRCASYQEDGYPAGRWRVPTQAEVEYIVQLSADGIIPVLFGDASENTITNYWSANGAIGVNAQAGTTTTDVSFTNSSTMSVRCVYDTWYWTDKCDKTDFTWGDKADF